MAYYSDQDPPGGSFHQATGARSEGLACGAGELRGLLQNIADHISHADERQEATLRDMQARLVHLAGEAQSVRAVVPQDLAAAFARIEDGITTLAGRIATDDAGPAARSGQTAWSGEEYHQVQSDQFDAGFEPQDETPSPRRQPADVYRSRGVTDAPPPLKSAAAFSDYDRWERDGAQPARQPHAAEAYEPRPQPDHENDHWDRASAEALTRLYEPQLPEAQHGFSPPQDSATAPERAGGACAVAARVYASGPGEVFDHGEPARDPRVNAARDYLEQRFSEIAVRLEETLASIRPESSVAALEARLDTFELKLGSAFDDLATRADVEKLKAIGTHINELAQHIDGAQSQLGRLDHIESHLTLLIEHISDERFVQLLDQRALSETHIAQLAEAVSARLAERDTHRHELEPGMDRLAELRDTIEQFVASRRQGDEYTVSALDTIQQAVLNLLDRMEALEQAHAYAQAAAFHGVDYARALPGPTPESNAADIDGIGAEIQHARHELSSEFPAQSASETPEDSRPGPASGAAEAVSPLNASREDFLAAARRAARKASSQAADSSDPVRPAMRRRAASGAQGGTGSRPVTRLVVTTLAVVLAVGIGLTTYSIYKETLILSPERNLIAPGAEHSAVDSDGEDMIEGAPAGGGSVDAPANREAAAPGSSNSLENVPEVIIDDLPVAPNVPDVDNETPRSRTVTGLPGGIMLDTRSTASPDDIARSHQQRTLAQLSTSLGAAQAGAVSIPAALIPQAGDSSPVLGRQSGNRIMPPAAVGPLSLRLAAANGDPSAEFEVAVRLAEGRGVKQDLKEAVSWYQRSAARGFAPAQYRLGTLYERGLGIDADRGRAMAWYRSAAEKGNLKAMHNLAVLSASSSPANYRGAAHWFGEAASRGLGDSQYNLAVLFETGRGVDRDLKQAYMWFALAARGGDKEAMRRRDRVKLMLDAAQFKSAEALVRSWKQVATEPLVNDARAAGEAWKQREGQS